jgi:anthranilate synthase/aminodeoxychorismate synthase-like glutamine amidotransferase
VQILLLDNYDSFTYNIVQLLMQLGHHPTVIQNDKISIEELEKISFSHLILSPGPGNPSQAGITLAAITKIAPRKIPILGICLGHQALAEAFGARVGFAQKVQHGKISNIENTGCGIFANLPPRFNVTRYHSLIVESDSSCRGVPAPLYYENPSADFYSKLPQEIEVTAWHSLADGSREIMAIQHKSLPCFGVQFHPEAILTEYGKELLMNFCDI